MNSGTNKTDNGKATNAGTADVKAPDVKMSTPANAADEPADRPGAPRPEIQGPGAEHHALLAAMRARSGNSADTDKGVKTRARI